MCNCCASDVWGRVGLHDSWNDSAFVVLGLCDDSITNELLMDVIKFPIGCCGVSFPCRVMFVCRGSSGDRDGISLAGFCVTGLKWLPLLLGLIGVFVSELARTELAESVDNCRAQFDELQKGNEFSNQFIMFERKSEMMGKNESYAFFDGSFDLLGFSLGVLCKISEE